MARLVLWRWLDSQQATFPLWVCGPLPRLPHEKVPDRESERGLGLTPRSPSRKWVYGGGARCSPGHMPPPLLLLPLLQDVVVRPDFTVHLLCPVALESSSLPLLRAAWPGEMIQLGTCVQSLGLSRRKPRMPPAAGRGRGWPVNFSPYTRFLSPMLGPGLDFWPGPQPTFG